MDILVPTLVQKCDFSSRPVNYLATDIDLDKNFYVNK